MLTLYEDTCFFDHQLILEHKLVTVDIDQNSVCHNISLAFFYQKYQQPFFQDFQDYEESIH